MSDPTADRIPPWLHLPTDREPTDRQPTDRQPTDRQPTTGTPPAGAVRLDGAACRDRAGLFTEWAARLRLPGYFGRNWDALADCLTDLVAAAPLTIALDDADRLLIDEPPAQLRTLLAVLHGVSARHPGRLTVHLRCPPAAAPALRQRVGAALPPTAAGS